MRHFQKILIFIMGASLFAQQVVAVLDFEGIGISKDEARALSNRFGTEFRSLSSGKYTLVERQHMDQILKEKGFQQAGIVSSDDAVKMGVALGAQFIVTGSISKVGTLFSINARLIDMKTAQIQKSISHDHMGDIMDLMTKGINVSAKKLLDLETEKKKETPSIAILPFKNKGAPEDEFYAFGISADLISDVAGAGLIRVASLNDIEKLDYQNLENIQLAKKLFVRYVSQGTLWKLGNMFQLSLEIFDTQLSKVIYTKRWQTEWEKLATIKDDLSKNILELLKVEVHSSGNDNAMVSNPEAYEYYLRAKHKLDKLQNKTDTEIARGLLEKAISLDENLLEAKSLLGDTHTSDGNYKEAMKIYSSTLKEAENLGKRDIMGRSLLSIGLLHYYLGDYKKELDHYHKALAIFEEIDDKSSIGLILNNLGSFAADYDNEKASEYYKESLEIFVSLDDKSMIALLLNNIGNLNSDSTSLSNHKKALAIFEELDNKGGIGNSLSLIGGVFSYKGDYDTALDYYMSALAIYDELGAKRQVGIVSINIGGLYANIGDLINASVYFNRSLEISQEIGYKLGVGVVFLNLGAVDFYNGEFENAATLFEKSYNIIMEIGLGPNDLILPIVYIALSNKRLGKSYDREAIHGFMEKTDEIDYELNFRLYQLFEERSDLEKAYIQLQENANQMDDDIKKKYLNYPLPKQIIEEWTILEN